MTGDGRDDIIGFGQAGVWEAQANADGSFAQPILELGAFGAGAGGWTSQDTYPRMMGDVTGHVMMFLMNMAVKHGDVLVRHQHIDGLGAVTRRPIPLRVKVE